MRDMSATVRIVFAILLFMLMAGCGPVNDADQPPNVTFSPSIPPPTAIRPSQTPTVSGDPAVTTPTQPTPADPVLRSLIDEAKTDLAQRLSLPVEQITLLEAAAVTWPDGSLGCPEEGMAYAQVLSPGYLIRVEAGGQEYEYHASRSTVFYCQNPSPPVSGDAPDV